MPHLDEINRRCMERFTKSSSFSDCDAPVIYKGKHTTTGPFLLDQTVTVRCDSGYHLEGSRTGTCVRNETFAFEVEPRCTGWCNVRNAVGLML